MSSEASAPDLLSGAQQHMSGHEDLHVASPGQREGHGDNRCLQHDRPISACAPNGEEHDSYECMFRQCREWLRQCLEDDTGKHKCHEPLVGGRFKDILPTRLIDVGVIGSYPRLVKFDSTEHDQGSSGSGTYPDYVTLSYCWGKNGDKTHLLRVENEVDFMLSLPRLPKTIQEAITICQRMRVRYIWVDAICIVQGHNDNSSDWEWQSARVGSYYANSLFTVAAAWADANDQGCLPICARSEPDQDWLKTVLSIQYHNEWPLLRRAWVAQELFMAARVIWMFDNCVEWTCGAGVNTYNGPVFGMSKFRQYPREWSPLSWYKLLGDYSETDLTFDEDLLPAISGVCKYFDPNEEDQYIAGIWLRTISYGMAWKRTNTTKPGNDLPSWSPLSCGGDFIFPGFRVTCSADKDCDICGTGKFKTLELDVETMYGDRHGKIKSARLVVQAAVSDVDPHINPAPEASESNLTLTDSKISVAGECYWDTPWQTSWQVQALLIGHEARDRHGDLHDWISLYFLLLLRVKPDVYRRVGLFTSSKLHRSDPVLNKIRARKYTRRVELI